MTRPVGVHRQSLRAGARGGSAARGAAAGAGGSALSSSLDQPRYWWYRVRARLLGRMFEGAVAGGACVLDVGSADGPSVDWLGDVAGRRVCADINARGLGPDGVCADALRLPFADCTFEVVSAFDVVEHFDDEAAVLDELVRVLRPGGALLLAVPAYQWAWTAFDVASGHHRRYTRGRLRRAVRRTPVDVERVTYAFAGVFPFFMVDRLRARIWPRPPSTALPEVRPIVERFLEQLSQIDEWLLPGVDLPFGSSVFLLARRTEDVGAAPRSSRG